MDFNVLAIDSSTNESIIMNGNALCEHFNITANELNNYIETGKPFSRNNKDWYFDLPSDTK